MKKTLVLVTLSLWALTSCTKSQSTKEFLNQADNTLTEQLKPTTLAQWVQNTHITPDTDFLASQASAKYTELATGYALRSKNFTGSTEDEKRQLDLMLRFLSMPAPSDPKKNAELAKLKTELESMYGSGKYCKTKDSCQNLGDLEKIMAESRNPNELLDAWTGWRTVSPPMKSKYEKVIALSNEGSQELGFKDTADLWKSNYDMSSDEFEKTIDAIWDDVRPLYEQLHCYVRSKLNAKYGNAVVPKEGPMPAHVFGNMWAQSWDNITPIVVPASKGTVDVTNLLKKADYDAVKMVKTAENFFVSLGMPQLPESFYERSLFTKPQDREVVCHASAWPIDGKDDVRIKMCIKIDEDNFTTIHHELGHIYYYLAYKELPLIYQGSANDGFHEAIGDTIELSMTPTYLKQIDLLKGEAQKDEINYLLKMALKKIAFLPFGLLVDKWRWQVFDGRITPATYNSGWWDLRKKYQGIVAPIERPADAFDPGAKYHIPGFTPYSRYFLAHILQFQFHRSLCETAGHTGPLHECSIFDSKPAGEKLWKMLQMGVSKPWPDALEVATGKREMDATAIRDYFAPLEKWLKEQNSNQKCGW